jgi:uncharacterized membrane protein YozB (DUF420 family)
MHNPLTPIVLFFVAFIAMALIWRGRRAIIAGNWIKHRNYMVAALILWLASVGAGWWSLRPVWRLVSERPLLWIWGALALAAALGLALVLYRVATHQLLPHKMAARPVSSLWLMANLASAVLFFMLWFTFTM